MNAPFTLSLMHEHARELFMSGIRAVDPCNLISQSVSLDGDRLLTIENSTSKYSADLENIERILVTGAGKSSASMAECLERILGRRITEGLVVTKYGFESPLEHIRLQSAGHPVPDENGLKGAEAIHDMIRRASASDLIINLISGGASALLPLPVSDISLKDKQQLTQLLLAGGAAIEEMNAVRKHLSRLKGGGFARVAHPATTISLILSDVVNDRLDTIGSGLTVPDTTTFHDAWKVLEKYNLVHRVPVAIGDVLRTGMAGGLHETPKPGDPVFDRVRNVIIGNIGMALDAIRIQAESLGYHSYLLGSTVTGEARVVARTHVEELRRSLAVQRYRLPACIISGGETTVTVKGGGKGGRNQEYCLDVAIGIEQMEGIVVLSGGTDGNDGPTDAAGAVVDGTTLAKGRRLGLDAAAFLNNNDSYSFFRRTGNLLHTGPTRTNVMDIQIWLVSPDR